MDTTLVNKINCCINLIKQTSFYTKMVDQLQKDDFSAQIQRVKSMQENGGIEMVIYEIGSMECSEESRLQFALALLLKNESNLVEDITIYDQNLSESERNAINHFQCQCHSNTIINRVQRPTLFFINGCKFYLWNNILEANKMPEDLSRIIILGKPMKQWVPCLPKNLREIKYPSTIIKNNADQVKEFMIWLRNGEDFSLSQEQWWNFHFGAAAAADLQQIALRHMFYNLMWHFFDGFVNQLEVISISDEEHGDISISWVNLSTHLKMCYFHYNPPGIYGLTRPLPPLMPVDMSMPTSDEIRVGDSVDASIRRLESSWFYKKFTETMKSPEFVQHFERLKTTQQQSTGNFKLSVVLYGVGKIEESENARLQFSLAILLKRDFEWVEELTAYEPQASPTEIKVIQRFGCDWISSNEKGWRFVHKPTLFFMPGAPLYLHNHLISANWGCDGLNKMIVLGNSFKTTRSIVPQMTYTFQVLDREGIVSEVPVSGQGSGPPEDCSYAFKFYSWHFFCSHSA